MHRERAGTDSANPLCKFNNSTPIYQIIRRFPVGSKSIHSVEEYE